MADKLGPSLTDIDVSTSKYCYLAELLNLEVKMLTVDLVNKCVIVNFSSYFHCFHVFYFDDDNIHVLFAVVGKITTNTT